MIPRIIHFVWVGPPIPAWALRNIEEFRRLNPDHEIILHGMEALNPAYSEIVKNCKDPCEVADLIRYSVLESSGGWYFDVDYWPFRPVSDIERAYALTGDEVFIAEVWASKLNPGWIGNAVLSSSAGNPLWPRLRAMALAAVPDGRLTYGPRLIRKLYEADPLNFILAPEAWFNGPKAEWSCRLYHAITANGNANMMRRFDERTGGQLPYAMHLWAWKYHKEISGKSAEAPRPNLRLGTYGAGNPRHASALTLPGYKFNAEGSLFTGVGLGLASLGFEVDMLTFDSRALLGARELPEILIAWNGMREPAASVIKEARRFGARVLLMEMGFWQRAKYTQIDKAGTQHRASWAARLREPAPPDGAERLSRFYPNGTTPIRAKKHGYILGIGQVPKDSQLWDSEIQSPLQLQRAIKAAVPAGLPVIFRPHPLCSNIKTPENKIILPILGDAKDAAIYRATKGGAGLNEALAGARFAITINSTAGNEAIAAGVPVLALGPALYCAAGVARQATIATMRADIQAMLDGWAPKQDAVDNYLRWLAARQWTADELSGGAVLRMLLAEAGINMPSSALPEPALPDPVAPLELQEAIA